MPLRINKPGIDIDGREFPFIQVEIDPQIEIHYDRVSIFTKCFNGNDVSSGIENPEEIVPVGWERFNPIKVPYEEEASEDLFSWSHQKALDEISSSKNLPYEYMAYEADVYDLDPSTGEYILDPSTNEPIKLHSKGELVKKLNGTYMFYTKEIPRFCETEDISIL
jgi:hypothetical protein